MPAEHPLRIGNAESQRGFSPSRCAGSAGTLLERPEDGISPFQPLLSRDQKSLWGCGWGSWYFPFKPYMVPLTPTADCCFLSQTIARENPLKMVSQWENTFPIRAGDMQRWREPDAPSLRGAGSCPIIFLSPGGSGDVGHRRPRVPGCSDAMRPHHQRSISSVPPAFKSPTLSR